MEQINITDGFIWANGQDLANLLTATFTMNLHKEMFGQVWGWAGKKRESNKNIGVLKEYIMNDLMILFGDVQYWIDHQTYPNDEIAARFHHGLVKIHVYPNGTEI